MTIQPRLDINFTTSMVEFKVNERDKPIKWILKELPPDTEDKSKSFRIDFMDGELDIFKGIDETIEITVSNS
jgi:hypothetical protein